ncbi:MAG TPA: hypothetical protein VF219_07005 [Vicinamibacterales bacterium]
MTKSIWTGTCAAIVGFATTAMIAQAPQTPQTPPPPPQASQATAASTEGKVTVTGCLKTAPPDATASTTGAAGSAGTTGAASPNAAADAKFLLTDATSAPAEARDSSGAPAPPTTPSATPAGSTYRVIANPSALTPHIGKKLALTGTIEKSAGATTPAASATTTASSEAPMLALRVESGKIVADTCTGQ